MLPAAHRQTPPTAALRRKLLIRVRPDAVTPATCGMPAGRSVNLARSGEARPNVFPSSHWVPGFRKFAAAGLIPIFSAEAALVGDPQLIFLRETNVEHNTSALLCLAWKLVILTGFDLMRSLKFGILFTLLVAPVLLSGCSQSPTAEFPSPVKPRPNNGLQVGPVDATNPQAPVAPEVGPP